MNTTPNFTPVPSLSYLGGGKNYIVGNVDEEQRLIEFVFNEWSIEQARTVLEEKNARYLYAFLDKFLNGNLPTKATRKISDSLNANRTEIYNRDVVKLIVSKGGVRVTESVVDIAEARILREYLKKFLGD